MEDFVFATYASGAVSLAGFLGLSLSGTLEFYGNTTGESVVDFGSFGTVVYQTAAESYIFRGVSLTFVIDGFLTFLADIQVESIRWR